MESRSAVSPRSRPRVDGPTSAISRRAQAGNTSSLGSVRLSGPRNRAKVRSSPRVLSQTGVTQGSVSPTVPVVTSQVVANTRRQRIWKWRSPRATGRQAALTSDRLSRFPGSRRVPAPPTGERHP